MILNIDVLNAYVPKDASIHNMSHIFMLLNVFII